MRKLIIPIVFITACGAASADEPTSALAAASSAIALAERAADKILSGVGNAPTTEDERYADTAKLKGTAQGLDDGLRQALHHSLGTFYPCVANDPRRTECIVAIGLGALQNATNMSRTMAFGRCSGASLRTESDDMLIGDYTAAPRGRDGFVNIGNRLCFWRDTGVRVDCPPPEPECR